ncbi:type II toxin-antitoxin system RelE/ParE family toxin [Dactylosporangium aurantiacum]|nr:type II toxin-antitoxin system RelE/ParE family toxin [Dactylosporangium aurantiacum]MDG6102144.1 type II toxin-antitoxin system RelE/ParE family toxin [Dactylosporangium aurantiacum]
MHDLRHSDRRTLVLISAAVDALAAEGPALGRPLVDTVRGSKLANLKESRPGSAGSSEVRLLFVFDPVRQAVLLVGGDKAGNWQGWYRTAIPIAETAYAEHLRRLQEKDGEQ